MNSEGSFGSAFYDILGVDSLVFGLFSDGVVDELIDFGDNSIGGGSFGRDSYSN